MRLHRRLDKLERGLGGGRCRLCRERPTAVLLAAGEDADEAAPCPSCAWRPRVIEVEELVVGAGGEEGPHAREGGE